MSHEGDFRACENRAKENTGSLTVWKQYFECYTVLFEAALNLRNSLLQNKVTENEVIVVFRLTEKAI